MPFLDKTNCMILGMMQENCRVSLTKIAKKVGLSIDSVTKRIKKMEHGKIFTPSILFRPHMFGFRNIVEVKIKFNNHSKKEMDAFVDSLKKDPQITEIFSVMGEWDMSIVIISKDNQDYARIASEIKNKFGGIINSWTGSVTLKAHKFEEYDFKGLMKNA